jgi:hypothetical protein
VGAQGVYSFWGMDGNTFVSRKCLAALLFDAAAQFRDAPQVKLLPETKAERIASSERMSAIAEVIEDVARRSGEEDKVKLMEMMSTIDEYLRAVR